MRKAQKKMALDHVGTQNQANAQIKTFIGEQNAAAAMELLELCRQGALGLSNLIEQTEGEYCSTLRLLDLYCKEIFHMYEEIGASAVGNYDINGDSIYTSLHEYLIQIENSIRNDIAERIEVVFLPYKASMWDSMESVWKAATEDENCDAYVIPVPYYDKNPDGSFREEHWEGDQFPACVPVTGYREYDFAKRRPDMIFIHNPYDECNYVTSIHPFFYSEKLKQYTDKLIYIPYFILNEISPDDPANLESIKHFCALPAVINADLVIVQSEEMRRAYINIMTEIGGEKTRGSWEKKILGLGSPKVDKVLNTRREDLEIPPEWLEIIQRPDGTWKRIVFYNTTVTALLQSEEKMLQKIRNVLKTFEQYQEEAALLWRPHPLIKATIESMRPQLWEGYQKIVDEYRTGGWGIYDDTADMNRALCLCDAYYGDGSSLVWLCKKAGMPVMIQNRDISGGLDG